MNCTMDAMTGLEHSLSILSELIILFVAEKALEEAAEDVDVNNEVVSIGNNSIPGSSCPL